MPAQHQMVQNVASLIAGKCSDEINDRIKTATRRAATMMCTVSALQLIHRADSAMASKFSERIKPLGVTKGDMPQCVQD
eukprot:4466658-Alexandrium_andersonii.AAC.1